MPRQLHYIPGQKIGPNNLLLLKRSDRVNSSNKHIFGIYQCPECGKSFEARNYDVKIGTTKRCPECLTLWRKTKSPVCTMNKKYYVGMELGPYKITLLKELPKRSKVRRGLFICPDCGEQWETNINDVIYGKARRCRKCSLKEFREITLEFNENCSLDLTNQKFGKLTAKYIVSSEQGHGKMWFCECDCGKNRIVSARDLHSNKILHCGCERKNRSRGELIIKIILDQCKISYEEEKYFTDCVNPISNKVLRFDFYLPDYNCCIEYDGEQHFKESTLCEDTLEERQYRDQIKNKYCEDHNIKLIRIPYWDYDKLDKDYLLSKIYK